MNEETTTVLLDATTEAKLSELARRWGVSREEAVRRAVTGAGMERNIDRLQALAELQRRLQLTPEKATAWRNLILDGRR